MINNEQQLINLMFEFAMRTHAGEYNHLDREQLGEFMRSQLRILGFDTEAIGSAWAVLK